MQSQKDKKNFSLLPKGWKSGGQGVGDGDVALKRRAVSPGQFQAEGSKDGRTQPLDLYRPPESHSILIGKRVTKRSDWIEEGEKKVDRVTTGEEDKGGIEGQLDLRELELGQALGKVKDARDQLGLHRVRREEGLHGEERVPKEDGVLAQVVVATHPEDGQLKTP